MWILTKLVVRTNEVSLVGGEGGVCSAEMKVPTVCLFGTQGLSASLVLQAVRFGLVLSVVVFDGTKEFSSFETVFTVWKSGTTWSECGDCKAHSGFLFEWQSLQQCIRRLWRLASVVPAPNQPESRGTRWARPSRPSPPCPWTAIDALNLDNHLCYMVVDTTILRCPVAQRAEPLEMDPSAQEFATFANLGNVVAWTAWDDAVQQLVCSLLETARRPPALCARSSSARGGAFDGLPDCAWVCQPQKKGQRALPWQHRVREEAEAPQRGSRSRGNKRRKGTSSHSRYSRHSGAHKAMIGLPSARAPSANGGWGASLMSWSQRQRWWWKTSHQLLLRSQALNGFEARRGLRGGATCASCGC